ncbi:MAG: hypothetical protein PHI40_07045 [Caldisericia bacterium]|nr:hypothetical protein [Caldisericia bacterium]
MDYKEKGILAIKENRLTDGINLILEAIKIQDEPELQSIIDDAYFERAEYFHSVGEKEKALSDIRNIKSKDNKSNDLYYKLLAENAILKFTYPSNETIVEELNIRVKWSSKPQCDSYQIQIEDSNWNTVLLETVTDNFILITDKFKDMSVYYCHVRAHYPTGVWSKWSEKIWFETRTPEGLRKKELVRVKKLIAINSFYTCTPNCVGGVDFHLIWTNQSPKTIKYAYFQVVPYNRVGDKVSCTIKNRPEAYLSVTGPIKQGQTVGYSNYWDALWYNSTIVKAKITEVKIEYMDGSKEIITEEYIQDLIQ